MQTPTIGRIVHYKLTASDAHLIDQQDPSGKAAGHPGRNPVSEGQVYPAMVVGVFGNGLYLNLKVFLDGGSAAEYWATSRSEGDEPGTWFWPPKA